MILQCKCKQDADLHSCGNYYLCRMKCSCGEGMIACFINDVIYSLDVLRDDGEIRFVC